MAGPMGAKVSHDFCQKKLLWPLGAYLARRDVHEVDVPEDVVGRVLGGHVVGSLADDDGELGLVVEVPGRHVRQDDGVAPTDHGAGRLEERVAVAHERAAAALHVVAGHADHPLRLRQRRPQTDVRGGRTPPPADAASSSAAR